MQWLILAVAGRVSAAEQLPTAAAVLAWTTVDKHSIVESERRALAFAAQLARSFFLLQMLSNSFKSRAESIGRIGEPVRRACHDQDMS